MTLLEVARVVRAHGVVGDVLVELISDRRERLDAGAELLGDRGVFRVVTARPHTRRWIVHFEGIDDRDAAEALRGTVLRAEAEERTEGLWVHEVIGLPVVDAAGVDRGVVAAVVPNPAHDLLELDDGTLVPSVFIVSVGDRIVVEVPEGIF